MSPAGRPHTSVEVMESMGLTAAGARGAVAAPSEAALVARLFTSEADRLVSLARFFVDDRTAAEDLVQEAFIRLSRSAHRIRDEERAAAYLRSIVINLARDHNRRGLVSLRHRPPAVVDEPSAEDTAAARESRQEVVDALRSLPRRQRDCIALRYYLELSIEDIATTLGVSPNSVKTHLQRGLRTLEHTLEERQ
jgi:RNA polymerase sigma-70 factor (sigma-E family)